MSYTVNFDINDIQLIESDFYSADEFAIAHIGFLGSNHNSHNLEISDEVLKECASSVLGKFLVAYVNPMTKDATTHTPQEIIVGYFPREQTVSFVEFNGFIRAYADAVVSKIYASDFCHIFENDNKRHVSVEMTIETENGNNLDDIVTEFNITGVTTLGKNVLPSSPGCDMEFIRFSKEKASVYFEKMKDNNFTIKSFAEERRINMADKYVNHSIDTSKDSVYDGEWDGDKAKQDLIKEKNYNSLAPKVCLRLDDGWKDREITKLGYPVMCLHNDKWVYSRKGLASALGYAKQHNDNDIVKKVEAIYKKLGLNSEGKEEDTKMAEINFAAVNIGDLWGQLYRAIRDYHHWEYDVHGIYEEDNQKFAILRDDAGKLYRLDFSLTEEEGLVCADEVTEVKEEFVETDNMMKFAEPENVAEYRHIAFEEDCKESDEDTDNDNDVEDDTDTEKFSAEDLAAQIAQLQANIEELDNIIMQKDAELETLRKFKQDREEQDKVKVVANVLNSVQEYLSDADVECYRAEGMACEFAQIDAWSNKVKASVVDKALSKNKKNADFTRIAGGYNNSEYQKSENVWDRIK